jgi:hypothetical protein
MLSNRRYQVTDDVEQPTMSSNRRWGAALLVALVALVVLVTHVHTVDNNSGAAMTSHQLPVLYDLPSSYLCAAVRTLACSRLGATCSIAF